MIGLLLAAHWQHDIQLGNVLAFLVMYLYVVWLDFLLAFVCDFFLWCNWTYSSCPLTPYIQLGIYLRFWWWLVCLGPYGDAVWINEDRFSITLPYDRGLGVGCFCNKTDSEATSSKTLLIMQSLCRAIWSSLPMGLQLCWQGKYIYILKNCSHDVFLALSKGL